MTDAYKQHLEPYLEKAVRAYGRHGDRSLEYVGLVIGRDHRIDRKIYRFCAEQDMDRSMEKAVWDTYFQEMSSRYPMRICDISKGANSEVPTFRMVVVPKEPLSLEQTFALAETCLDYVPVNVKKRFLDNIRNFHTMFHTADSPLIQLGVEVDAQSRYIGLKYYLQFADTRANPPIHSLWASQEGEGDAAEMEALTAKICECDYAPIFLGVNDDDTCYESKLYFVSKLFGRTLCQKVHTQITALCLALHLKKQLYAALVYAADELHLYPEGVAISANGRIRLYLKEIPAKLLKASYSANR